MEREAGSFVTDKDGNAQPNPGDEAMTKKNSSQQTEPSDKKRPETAHKKGG
ncbi:MAG: hypothetical protein HZB80_11305 [Deltaproteobacteria bacterium]|nr:hypothetical protein [Deltaproteobacteria bacterium]